MQLRTTGLVLAAVGALGAALAAAGLLGVGGFVPGLLLLVLTVPLMLAADSAMRGATDKPQRLRATLGLLTWFAGAGIVIFGPNLALGAGVVQAGLAITMLSGAALVLAGWGLLQPPATRQQRRQARERA